MPWSTRRAPRPSLCHSERLFQPRRNRQALWITAVGSARRAAGRPTQQCDKPTTSSRDYGISSSFDMTNPLMPIDGWRVVRSDLWRTRPRGLVRAIPSISGSPYGVHARAYSFFTKCLCCRNEIWCSFSAIFAGNISTASLPSVCHFHSYDRETKTSPMQRAAALARRYLFMSGSHITPETR